MIEIKYILPFTLSFLFIYLLIRHASKIGILDIPNDRSIHASTIPRSGGIGFISALFISFALLETALFLQYIYMFLAIAIVFIAGFYDDYKNLSPRIKFFAIGSSTLFLYFNNIYIDSLGIYFGFDATLFYLSIPFTIFVVSGFTNALNLIDGLDGLAGGISIVILATFAYVGFVFNDELIFLLSMFSISVLVAFTMFNWSPAKIFMGDSGSLSIGFIISTIAILSIKHIHPVIILYFAAIPIIDTVVVMLRRINTKRSPFLADKTHIHHILYKFFGDAKQTATFLILAQLIFCFLGYVVARHIEHYPNGLFPIAMIFTFFILIAMAYMIFTTILKKR
ncbi:MAG: MraY family glycosyltransferase [Campylobacterota bacterium]